MYKLYLFCYIYSPKRMNIRNTFSRDKHLIFVLFSSALIFLPFECSPNGMTRGKNSRRFRGIGKDFRGEKKSTRDCGFHRDVQQSCAKFDRARRSSAARLRLKFPLLYVQVTANDVHGRDKRARMIISSQAEKSEKFAPAEHGVAPMLPPSGVLVREPHNLCMFP